MRNSELHNSCQVARKVTWESELKLKSYAFHIIVSHEKMIQNIKKYVYKHR